MRAYRLTERIEEVFSRCSYQESALTGCIEGLRVVRMYGERVMVPTCHIFCCRLQRIPFSLRILPQS